MKNQLFEKGLNDPRAEPDKFPTFSNSKSQNHTLVQHQAQIIIETLL